MKNYSLFIIMLIIASALHLNIANAQNEIPNNSFEDWSAGAPIDWDTSNESVLGINFICVTKESNSPQAGSASAKIKTVTNNIFLIGPVTMPGILTLGEVVIDILNGTGTVTGGAPVTGNPKFLKGYLKYEPQGGDSCIMGIGLTKWNGTSRDTIGFGYKTIGSTITSWEEFSLPIEYYQWIEPDSMNIMFMSSNMISGTPVTNSTMWVDNLSLEYSGVNVKDIGADKELFVYAIENGNFIVADVKQNKAKRIDLFSISGATVLSKEGTFEGQTHLNITDLQKGNYILRVTFTNGKTKSVKFTRL